MGLSDMIRAIQEYPAVRAELETARFELRQTQQALEQSEQVCAALRNEAGERSNRERFLARQLAAVQTTLGEFCPRLTSTGDIKRLYNVIATKVDPENFTLYRMAKELTGIDVPSCFPYEDSCGLFEEMDGHKLLHWLTSAYFHAVGWTVVPGTTHEKAMLRKLDTSAPEYQAFEKQLYEKVLERMGFQDMLALSQDESARMSSHPLPQPKRGDAR